LKNNLLKLDTATQSLKTTAHNKADLDNIILKFNTANQTGALHKQTVVVLVTQRKGVLYEVTHEESGDLKDNQIHTALRRDQKQTKKEKEEDDEEGEKQIIRPISIISY
jgi:hypothetical protein